MAEEYDLIISKEGYEWSDTDPTHHIFNTNLSQSIKVYGKNKVSVSIDGNSALTVQIAHGLSFIPLSSIAIELKPSTGNYYFGIIGYGAIEIGDSNGGGLHINDAYCDDTYLNVVLYNDESSTKTINIAYLIFADNGQ